MKTLITGAKGMLGQDLARVFQDRSELILTDRDELDITSAAAVDRYINEHQPDLIINAAAYNLVDKIEEPEVYPLAYAINALGPGYLAKAAKRVGATFVHYSTDYVFEGNAIGGYEESDIPNPISLYGQTKYNGELNVRSIGGCWFICRLSKIFGEPAKSAGAKESFVQLMIRLAKELPELKIVNEEVGCPSYTVDIAKATANLIAEAKPGIYHLINEGGGVTPYDFAKEIFNLHGVTTPYRPVPATEFPRPAKRPKYARLLNTKTAPLRTRQEALKEFLTRVEPLF